MARVAAGLRGPAPGCIAPDAAAAALGGGRCRCAGTPGRGKPLRECACCVVRAGEVRAANTPSNCCPATNIFNERRHFEPGPDVAKVLRIGTAQVGFLICEDGWNDDGDGDYAHQSHSTRLRDAAPDVVIVSINASPSNIGKREQRHQIFAAASRRHGLPLLYVNQVGGHDQLVYDGASFRGRARRPVWCSKRPLRLRTCARCASTERGFLSACDGSALPAVPALPACPRWPSTAADRAGPARLRAALRLHAGGGRQLGRHRLGLDPGAGRRGARPENVVTAITMPSVYSSAGSVADSQALCDNLGMSSC